MQFVSFQDDTVSTPYEHDLAEEYPLLHLILSSLRLSGCLYLQAKTGTLGRLGFDDICKIYILTNLEVGFDDPCKTSV